MAPHRNANRSVPSTFQIWNMSVDDLTQPSRENSDDDVKAAPCDGKNDSKGTIRPRRSFGKPCKKRPHHAVRGTLNSPSTAPDVKNRNEMEARLHKDFLRRRVIRMVHSSDKLELSRRLSTIIRNSSPQLSPVKAVNLKVHFKYSNIVEITRETRKAVHVARKKK